MATNINHFQECPMCNDKKIVGWTKLERYMLFFVSPPSPILCNLCKGGLKPIPYKSIMLSTNSNETIYTPYTLEELLGKE